MKKTQPTKEDPLAHLENIRFLVESEGEISLGRVGPFRCVATASDENTCLAMLRQRPGESLYELLVRLDQAIDRAWNEDKFTDEINDSN